MDSTLDPTLPLLARNLLSTSKSFEPLIPYSQQNGIYALQILSHLGKITQVSFAQKTTRTTQESLPPQPAQRTASSQSSAAQQNRHGLKDQKLIDALMKLRESHRLLKNQGGIYSPILRVRPS